ncbi:MAG: dienelactone hydrolase family protein [Gammaproteobacteria bacterium]|nr:dienelactone hydrolase family protein [Gammaproteobacteria bacterium]NIR28464.1 dienelactone hydrolase family protein [Gammaproteobacteria bacterium]NIR96910.1 dienelactone hydrolase family protein [Gammaproteobacteria bacterium]NIT62611.1 dienelactone hydrolase family protein [Gammaproteobacteria bacterium]NIV19568.1 alpha/beta hydrolase [Gammaproteobacteria bacterium]
MNARDAIAHKPVAIEHQGAVLEGDLAVPEQPAGAVLFAHGSGSSRFSTRNRFVADVLNRAGLMTLLFDLLTAEEHEIDQRTRHLRFDIPLLSRRLIGAVDWAAVQPGLGELGIGLFGASTGAAAALIAAAERPGQVAAVVSRGGRPDLAGETLARVKAPVLMVVGGEDFTVIELNREAARALQCEHRTDIVPGATHLFEEPGALEQVAKLARDWFLEHLATAG